jgi:hypothetical protein
MDERLLDRLTPADRAALLKVAQLLGEAQEVWDQIEDGKQSELSAEHSEKHSLAHCLRWGAQAADDLVGLTSSNADSGS